MAWALGDRFRLLLLALLLALLLTLLHLLLLLLLQDVVCDGAQPELRHSRHPARQAGHRIEIPQLPREESLRLRRVVLHAILDGKESILNRRPRDVVDRNVFLHKGRQGLAAVVSSRCGASFVHPDVESLQSIRPKTGDHPFPQHNARLQLLSRQETKAAARGQQGYVVNGTRPAADLAALRAFGRRSVFSRGFFRRCDQAIHPASSHQALLAGQILLACVKCLVLALQAQL
mmetsp:Transcript_6617/g.25549  ORF Transcript_6617/g.25549 Transcript_6617/m.25549 type:complete len:232 (+) Transcript_6617:622-1317(+)